MEKIKRYSVLEVTDLHNLVDEVIRLMKEDWQPLGGVQFCTNPNWSSGVWVQTMVKY